jgi:hypothetical protein
VGSDSGERSSRIQVGTSDSQRLDVKNQQEIIHWHTRYVLQQHLSCSVLDIVWLTFQNVNCEIIVICYLISQGSCSSCFTLVKRSGKTEWEGHIHSRP